MENPAKCIGPRLALFVALLGLVFPAAQPAQAQSNLAQAQVGGILGSGRGLAVEAPSRRQSAAARVIPNHGAWHSGNWAGYAVLGSGFTLVQGDWIVPKVNCTETPNSTSDYWVGFNGFPSGGHPQQTGISADCNGEYPYYAWYQFTDNDKDTCYTHGEIKLNDQIHAEVSYNDSTFVFTTTLTDVTRPGLPPCTNHWSAGSSIPRSSAEWIVEKSALPLADFGTVDFSSASLDHLAIGAYGGNAAPIILLYNGNGPVEALPSSLSPEGNSFSVTTYIEFDAPGAGTGAYQGTLPISANAAGAVTGTYTDASGLAHGFIRDSNGNLTPFSAPGAGTGASLGTFAVSINTADAIVGVYADASNVYHGFVRDSSGHITSFDAPGVGTVPYEGTIPTSINTAGVVAGTYVDPEGPAHGFVRDSSGHITSFDVTNPPGGTFPLGINAAGAIVGMYQLPECLAQGGGGNAYHGFVRAANGTITTFDAPGAGCTGTDPISINQAGEIAGSYTDTNCVRHGFVGSPSGTITPFDAPGAGAGIGWLQGSLAGTLAMSINSAGDVTGGFADDNGVYHGFLRTSDGTMASPVNAWLAGLAPLQGTAGISINDQGYIVGAYLDTNSVAHGFLHFLPSGQSGLNGQ